MANSHQTSKDTSLGVQEQITHLKELLQRKQDNWAEVCDVEAVEADESKRRQQKSAYDLDRLIEQLSKVMFEEEEARVSKIEESINTENMMASLAFILEETHRERMNDLMTLRQGAYHKEEVEKEV